MGSKRLLCLAAAVAVALTGAASVESAQSRAPRFLVTITGTQHFEWRLKDVSSGPCAFEGLGEQDETFGTSRPVKVIAPKGTARQVETNFRSGDGEHVASIRRDPLRRRSLEAVRRSAAC